ncbi:MAG: 4-hydroxy-3-methylbut-2-enyl diphosphate reductase [Lautropia sp.]|nr:4-hydroxy-3-methylbut-2-enyl diphosphate reductase [Lautropia sp.]
MGMLKETDLTAVDLHRRPGGAGGPVEGQGDVQALLAAELPGDGEGVLLAQPRGFCAGVDRAITIVERALALHGAPIYVRHEIVHNDYVVATLREKGAIFVDELDEVPDGATVIFSAHGVSRAVRAEAAGRGLQVFDATCPLVTKVHVEVTKMRREGHHVIMIGHAGHPEVQGTMGQADDGIYLVETEADVATLQVPDGATLAYVTQTTLSVDDCRAVIDALRRRFPDIAEPKKQDICYATQNRQDAVKFMAPQCDLVLIIGSPSSSNSNRLREVAERHGCAAYLIGNAAELDPAWLEGRRRVGVSAGASAPEILVDELVARLRELGVKSVRPLDGVQENMAFPLPKGLSTKRQTDAVQAAGQEQVS